MLNFDFGYILNQAVFVSFIGVEGENQGDLCTYLKTGKSFLVQEYFRCHTCGFDETVNLGVCKICVKTCHSGHDVTFAKNDLFFCDCGAKGETSCRALVKKQNGMFSRPSNKRRGTPINFSENFHPTRSHFIPYIY